jgi:uncharacterized protein (DUF1778 family)
MVTAKRKEERLSVRTTTEKKELIARAAERIDKNISEFVLETAVSAAEAVLGDDAKFSPQMPNRNALPWSSMLRRVEFPHSGNY